MVWVRIGAVLLIFVAGCSTVGQEAATATSVVAEATIAGPPTRVTISAAPDTVAAPIADAPTTEWSQPASAAEAPAASPIRPPVCEDEFANCTVSWPSDESPSSVSFDEIGAGQAIMTVKIAGIDTSATTLTATVIGPPRVVDSPNRADRMLIATTGVFSKGASFTVWSVTADGSVVEYQDSGFDWAITDSGYFAVANTGDLFEYPPSVSFLAVRPGGFQKFAWAEIVGSACRLFDVDLAAVDQTLDVAQTALCAEPIVTSWFDGPATPPCSHSDASFVSCWVAWPDADSVVEIDRQPGADTDGLVTVNLPGLTPEPRESPGREFSEIVRSAPFPPYVQPLGGDRRALIVPIELFPQNVDMAVWVIGPDRMAVRGGTISGTGTQLTESGYLAVTAHVGATTSASTFYLERDAELLEIATAYTEYQQDGTVARCKVENGPRFEAAGISVDIAQSHFCQESG